MLMKVEIVPMSEKTCDHCGEAYQPRQHSQRFCTPTCHHAWHSTRRRVAVEWFKEHHESETEALHHDQ
jgi:hypothetical protein